MKLGTFLSSVRGTNHWLRNMSVAVFCLTLTACGGGSSGSTTYTVNAVAGVGGSISPAAATVAKGETMDFTVTPDAGRDISNVSGCGGSLSGSTYTTGAITADCTVTASFAVPFSDGQAASVVIGQADFTSNVAALTQSGITGPYGNPDVINGVLYLGEYDNSRVLGFNTIPTTNGAAADFVLGASDFITTGSLGGSDTVAHYDNRLFVACFDANQIAIYDPIPTANTTVALTITASGVGGFTDLETIAVAGGKLVAADSSNNRVLIWNTVPTTDADPDLVLGQADFNSFAANRGGSVAANTLNYPAGVWTDGERLVISDDSNNRVLIWNTFPTSNGQAADLVLGQTDFASNLANQGGAVSASTLNTPYDGVYVSGNQLFVTDANNNRVLIWNSWPTANGQAADRVLGQADFTTATTGITDATLDFPSGVFLYGSQLFVADTNNNRYLIFNGN